VGCGVESREKERLCVIVISVWIAKRAWPSIVIRACVEPEEERRKESLERETIARKGMAFLE